MRLIIAACVVALLGSACSPPPDGPPSKAKQPPSPAPLAADDGPAPAHAVAPEPAAPEAPSAPENPDEVDVSADDFRYQVEQFADLRILRYRVPGFDSLSLRDKQLAYYLYEAALSGRDITWDQKHRHNLLVRRTLEAIDRTFTGDRETPAFEAFTTYLKRVWFSYGIHHHYSTRKFEPGFDRAAWDALVLGADPDALPLADGETPAGLAARLAPLLFDPEVDAVGVSTSGDLVAASANNFYGPDVTQAEVEAFYEARRDGDDPKPVMWGLNSRLERGADGALVERPWKVGGVYGEALERVVGWLDKAVGVAENDAQRAALEALIRYYRSGDLADFDAYSVAWVKDTGSVIDHVNGFIETYGDAMDMRGTFEAIVSLRDPEASERINAISAEAAWFEANSPIADAFKKPDVRGIDAKVITVIVGAGDASPAFPIGINLPNSDWIRDVHGSKSVSLGNITESYEEAGKASGLLEEFTLSDDERALARAHDALADKLHTDMHEVIGHASGRLADGVAPLSETLKVYASALEEARADLVALYYMLDPKLVEMGVMGSLDVGRAGYNAYLRKGYLVQLARVEPGGTFEQAHLRARALISRWVVERGGEDGSVEVVTDDGETYVVVRDHEKLRGHFGALLAEVQRIKSEGDYEAGRALVEGYGVKIDPELHAEVRARYEKLGIAPFGGFINPRLVPVREGDAIVDVRVEYPDDFAAQMREYAKRYSTLPTPTR